MFVLLIYNFNVIKRKKDAWWLRLKALVLGAGHIGTAIIYDLLNFTPKANEIYVVDIDDRKLKEVSQRFKDQNVKTILVDVTKFNTLSQLISEVDVVCSALPGKMSFNVVKQFLSYGVNLVDTSYMPEDPFKLSELVEESGTTYVPDSGFCPGISNLLIGHAYSNLGDVINVQIIVGGLPQDPRPPLYYTITWSIDDLLDEYTRPARIIKNGQLKQVDPLSVIMRINLEGLGSFEAIYTDGLRTLLKTIKAQNMFELTIRYPGHLSKIRTLRDLGFLSDREIRIKNQIIRPRKITVELLKDLMKSRDLRDVAILRIIVDGHSKGRMKRYRFDMIDKYDESAGLTAMSRTTGFTCAIIARLVAKGKIGKGVVPLELIGQKKNLYEAIIKDLEKRDITIKTIAPK